MTESAESVARIEEPTVGDGVGEVTVVIYEHVLRRHGERVARGGGPVNDEVHLAVAIEICCADPDPVDPGEADLVPDVREPFPQAPVTPRSAGAARRTTTIRCRPVQTCVLRR